MFSEKADTIMFDCKNDKELILRDYLALERTRLANTRTLFAYIRTALYLLTAGIGVLQIESISRLDGLAWLCILSGAILFFLGFVRYRQIKKHLKSYTDQQQSGQIKSGSDQPITNHTEKTGNNPH